MRVMFSPNQLQIQSLEISMVFTLLVIQIHLNKLYNSRQQSFRISEFIISITLLAFRI
jgi:hypothetical protein